MPATGITFSVRLMLKKCHLNCISLDDNRDGCIHLLPRCTKYFFFFFFHIVLPCQMLLTEGDMKHWPFGKLSALC